MHGACGPVDEEATQRAVPLGAPKDRIEKRRIEHNIIRRAEKALPDEHAIIDQGRDPSLAGKNVEIQDSTQNMSEGVFVEDGVPLDKAKLAAWGLFRPVETSIESFPAEVKMNMNQSQNTHTGATSLGKVLLEP